MSARREPVSGCRQVPRRCHMNGMHHASMLQHAVVTGWMGTLRIALLSRQCRCAVHEASHGSPKTKKDAVHHLCVWCQISGRLDLNLKVSAPDRHAISSTLSRLAAGTARTSVCVQSTPIYHKALWSVQQLRLHHFTQERVATRLIESDGTVKTSCSRQLKLPRAAYLGAWCGC